ncbi:MAG: serine hydrolase domain-containing protein [Bacteroidia bacterium]
MKKSFFFTLGLMGLGVLLTASYKPILRSSMAASALPTVKYPVFEQMDTSTPELAETIKNLDSLFRHKVKTEGFNGCVLIARQGTELYKKSFGYADYYAKDTLTPNSSFQLASVSKIFTAAAVLRLKEQGKLNLDDLVTKHLPEFPYPTVTVRMLLNHRSGLPNYLHFNGKYWKDRNALMTNYHVLDMMIKHNIGLTFTPGTRFTYCNTNYVILAYLVERVCGYPFRDFMMSNFFVPLGMYNSWVFDFSANHPTKTYGYSKGWNIDEFKPEDGVVGDKGMYASVEDLYKWDQALYTGAILSPSSLAETWTPYSFEHPGKKNYGLGWRLIQQPDNNYMPYHQGWWHSYNTAYYRIPQDKATIIVLSNRYNRGVYNVQPIWNIIYWGSGIAGYLKAVEPDE